MLSCKQVTEQADDYLEQQLPVSKRLQFKLHLLVCQHCRRYLRQINTTIGILRCTAPTLKDAEAEKIVEKIIDEKDKP